MERDTNRAELRGISRGSLVLVLALGLASFLQYAFFVSLGWLLSPAEYGILGVAMALWLILSFVVDAGFPRAASKFLAEEKADQARVFKTSLLANLILGLGIAIIFYLGPRRWFLLGDDYGPVIDVVLISVVVMAPAFVCRYALQGFFKFIELGSVDIFQMVFQIIFGIFFVLVGWGVLGASLGILAGALALLAFSLFFLRGASLGGATGWASPTIYIFAAPMFLGSLALTLIVNIDILGLRFLTQAAAADEPAGYYRSAMVIARIPPLITMAVMTAVFPYISRYSSSEKAALGLDVLNKAARYACLFVLPLVVPLMVIPRQVLLMFYPSGYAPAAEALPLLALGMGALALIFILAQGFQAMGRPWLTAKLLFPALLLQLGLLYALIPSLGLRGAALATALACLAGLLLLATRYFLAYRPALSWRNARALVPFLILGAFLWVFPSSSRLLTLVALGLGAILYLVSLALFKVLTAADVEVLRSSLPTKRFALFRGIGLRLGRGVRFLNQVF